MLNKITILDFIHTFSHNNNVEQNLKNYINLFWKINFT